VTAATPAYERKMDNDLDNCRSAWAPQQAKW